jgi:hypothetical protein
MIFYLFFLIGLVDSLRRYSLLFITLAFICMTYGLMIFFMRQEGIQASIQVVRYSIALFPLILVTVALGVNRALKFLRPILGSLKTAKVLLFLIPLAFLFNALSLGPLPDIYKATNNFTNHFAYQGSYAAHQWDVSKPQAFKPGYVMPKGQVPEFYLRLAQEPQQIHILEYPLLIGDTFNLYYYYQHFHAKKMLAGYLRTPADPEPRNHDFVYGVYPIDYVLGRLSDPSKHRFRNMIEMTNIEKIRKANIKYLIVHKNILAEMAPYLVQNKSAADPAARQLRELFQDHFNKPVYEDGKIIVFEV